MRSCFFFWKFKSIKTKKKLSLWVWLDFWTMSDSFSQNGPKTSIWVRIKLHCLLQAGHKVYVPSPPPETASVWRSDVMLSEEKYKHVPLSSLHTSSLLSVDILTVGTGGQTQDKLPSQQGLKWKLISVVGFHSESKHLILDIIVKR